MKFLINIKTYALGISLVLIPSTAKPMHSTAAQRILSKFCTALSWGIAAGPSFYEGAKKVRLWREDKKYIDQLEDESPEVTQFVHKVLKERGIKDYQTIAVKKRLVGQIGHPFDHASNSRAILIGQEPSRAIPGEPAFPFQIECSYLNLRELAELTAYHQKLDENLRQKAWLEKQQLSPDVNQQHVQAALKSCNESLNIHRAYIHHEAAHIVNKDGVREAIAHFVIPFSTHGSLTLCARPLKQLLNNRHKVNILTKGILKIFNAALIKYPINYVMPYAYFRYQEQRADDYVADDLSLLRSYRDNWKWLHKYSRAMHIFIEQDNNDERKKQRRELLNRYPIIANILYAIGDPEHPSPLQRKAKLEKRIAKLEQQKSIATQRE